MRSREAAASEGVRAPVGLLAELTHRCPLQCPYCSNPLELERANAELDTAAWQGVLSQAARLGVLQVHLSGGEPTVRRDLEDIVATAAEAGLYTNLITAGVLLTRERLEALVGASAGQWVQLEKFLEPYVTVPDVARTALASSFGAALEMAREGRVELSQEKPFAPIYMRKRESGAEWQRVT